MKLYSVWEEVHIWENCKEQQENCLHHLRIKVRDLIRERHKAGTSGTGDAYYVNLGDGNTVVSMLVLESQIRCIISSMNNIGYN